MQTTISDGVFHHSFTEFSSPEGITFCRKIASQSLPWDPHDYQVEGACKALDEVDVFATTPTGSGKTGFVLVYMLVAQAIAKDKDLCPKELRSRFRADPCAVVVCPTKSLEHDMAPKFEAAGLTTVVINADTTQAARLVGKDLWESARSHTAIILLSPEQLSTTEFHALAQDKTFADRVMVLTVDEAHLLCDWGLRFRISFKHIGHVRARFPRSPTLIALTATICEGLQIETVCGFLGLHRGQYHRIQRSNARYDIKWLFRMAHSGAKAMTFPELDWTVETSLSRRVIIFCNTIALSHRVASYLWAKASHLDGHSERVRVFTSLCTPSYNQKTLEFLRDVSDTGWRVTIGTDTMALGVDAVGTDDVVSFGHIPTDLNMMVQRPGRIRDGRGRRARAIVYLPQDAEERAKASLAHWAKLMVDGRVTSPQHKPAPSQSDGEGRFIDPYVARVILAKCKIDELNTIYDNPQVDVPCACQTCSLRAPVPRPVPCNCSGCLPEGHTDRPVTTEQDQTIASTSDQIALAASLPKAQGTAREKGILKVTKKMREHGAERLREFRWEVYSGGDDAEMAMVYEEDILSERLMKRLFDKMTVVVGDIEALKSFLADDPDGIYVQPHAIALFQKLQGLHHDFKQMQDDIRLAANAKRRATAQAKRMASSALADPGNESPTTAAVAMLASPDVHPEVNLAVSHRSAGRIKIPGGRFKNS